MDMEGQLTHRQNNSKREAPLGQIVGRYEILRCRSSKDWHLDILAEWLQPPHWNGSLCFQFEICHASREHEDLDYPTIFRVDDSTVVLVVV